MTLLLDSTDKAILSILEVNGRASYREIARTLGLPESTVRSRTQKLLGSEFLSVVVTGNPLKLGIPVLAICLVRVEPSLANDIASTLITMTAVRYTGICLGATTVITESLHDSAMTLHKFLAEDVPAIQGVQQVESYQIIEVCKSTWNWSQWLSSDKEAVVTTEPK
jgi:Lrp/AsnC family transcriptional regulator for asnA, asnC and gidA